MSKADVQVTIGASLGDLRRDLGQAGQMVDDFKKGASRARESAMYFGNAIQQIGGASSVASRAAGSLIGGFAIGGPMGLAVAGVNALITIIGGLREEQRKAAEENKKQTADRIKGYQDAAEAAARERASRIGGEVGVAKYDAEKDRVKLSNDLMLAKQTRDQAQKRLDDAEAKLAKDKADAERVGVEFDNDVRQLALKSLREELHAANMVVAELQDLQRQIVPGGSAKVQAAVTKVETKTATKAEGDAQTKADEARDAAQAVIDTKSDAVIDQAEADLKAGVAAAVAMAKAEEEARQQLLDLQQDLLDTQSDATTDQAAADLQSGVAAAVARDAAEQAAQKKKQDNAAAALQGMTAEWEQRLGPLEGGFSDLFTSIALDSENAGKAVQRVFKGIAASYIQMMMQMLARKVASSIAEKALSNQAIGQNAAEAASGAAKSQAGIPIIGPGLALAAMAAMMVAVLALKSAEGGYDIGAGVNPLVQAHAKEMILPARYADVIRGLAANGGVQGGQGDVWNLTIHATDAASFQDLLERNPRALRDAMTMHIRNGRL